MAVTLKDIETRALQLSPKERGDLIRCLILSFDGDSEDSPESVAKAWDEEMARRTADMDAGKTVWVPAASFLARFNALVESAR